MLVTYLQVVDNYVILKSGIILSMLTIVHWTVKP